MLCSSVTEYILVLLLYCVCLQAIQSPGVEGVQEKAWSAVVPLVGKLKTFYQFSQKLGKSPKTTFPFETTSCCSSENLKRHFVMTDLKDENQLLHQEVLQRPVGGNGVMMSHSGLLVSCC